MWYGWNMYLGRRGLCLAISHERGLSKIDVSKACRQTKENPMKGSNAILTSPPLKWAHLGYRACIYMPGMDEPVYRTGS